MVNSLVIWLLRRFAYVRELERQVDQHAEYIAGKATLKDIAIQNGAFTLEASSEMVQIIATHMSTLLDGHNAENYIEMEMRHEDGRRFAVTVQRCEGKTPHQKRLDAEAELRSYLAATETPRPRDSA